MPEETKTTKPLAEVSEANPAKDYNVLVEQEMKIFKLSKDKVKEITDDDLVLLFSRAEKLGLINQQVVLSGGLEMVSLSDWQYSSDNGVSWENITLPHTCNAGDATTVEYFRGSRKYKANFSIAYTNFARFLLFHKVGQRCDIYLNNKLLASHIGGYTPFLVDLSTAVKGNNEILVETFNDENPDQIPYSAPYNIENGLYDYVYLITSDTICFDPVEFGKDRAHVTQLDIQDNTATFRVNTRIIGKADKMSIKYYVRDHTNSIIESGLTENIKLVDVYNYSKTFTLNDPHLWNGTLDPYLYTVELILYNGDFKVDTVSIKTGLKYMTLDPTEGFLLNGVPYRLRGFGMIQDYPNKSMAMKEEDFDKDFEIIKSTGANFLRLAYYPHSDYVFKKCDELGIIVQTEIPWLNHYGVDVSEGYIASIQSALTETINHFYNHASCVFIGINDKLNNSDLDIGKVNPQGEFDYTGAANKTIELYNYAKTLTNQHLIGMSGNDLTFKNNRANVKDWPVDWIGSIQYKGWESGSIFDHFGEAMDEYRNTFHFMAVTEYGAGANLDQHSADPLNDRKNYSNPPHFEEYQNILHESYLEQIESRKWLLFTSAWCLFDFAVSGLSDGNVAFQNDKGLVTRDRQTYKDAFYLYKAKWNPEPTIYITSRRFIERHTNQIQIKVYGNMEQITLYQNDVEVQVLTAPTKCGVVWEFNQITFKSSADVFKVVGKKNGTFYTDIVTFRSTGV